MIYGIKNTPLRKLAPLNFFVNITAKASAITFEKITKQIVYFVVNPSAGRKYNESEKIYKKCLGNYE